MATAGIPVEQVAPVVPAAEVKNPTLSEAIESALESQDVKNNKVEGKDKTEVRKPEEVKKPDAAAAEDEEKELNLQGRNLMLALKDPAKAAVIVQFLAEQNGYIKAPPETKAEVKEAKNEILDSLKEHLGDEFSFLADKLAPAIEKALKTAVEANTKDIREGFLKAEQEKVADVSNKAIEALSTDYFGTPELPKEVVDEMSRLIDKYKPAPTDDIKDYVKDMFTMAVANKGLAKVKAADKDKITKNRTDVASRLSSERATAEPSGKIVSPKTSMTLKQAVEAAAEAVDKT